MNRYEAGAEIFLRPGDYYFGDDPIRVRTLLGSCIALTLWHARRRIGGMCHYLLPHRPQGTRQERDARYADDAIDLLVEAMRRAGTRLQEYEVKMFGGGNMLSGGEACRTNHIGRRNRDAGEALLKRHGLRCVAWDVGGGGHRNLAFDLRTGEVWMRWTPASMNEQCINCVCRSQCQR